MKAVSSISQASKPAKKRKSSEGECENVSPNLEISLLSGEKISSSQQLPSENSAIKKSRFNIFKSPQAAIQKMLEPSKQTSTEVPKEKKSSLPRYSGAETRKRSALTSTTERSNNLATAVATPVDKVGLSAASAPPISFATTMSAVLSPAAACASPPNMDSSLSRSPMSVKLGKGTPRSSIGKSGRLSIGRTRIKTTRASIGGKIKNYFETSAAILNEEKLNDMLNKKAKAKRWDYKDKAKNQDATIVELKAALKQMIDEHRSLKEKCIGAEMNISENFKDVDQQRQDLLNEVDNLRAKESKYMKDFYQTSTELSVANTARQQLMLELEKLREKILILERNEADYLNKLTVEESLRRTAEQELARLSGELDLTKKWLKESSSSLNNQIEQRLEQSVGGYKEQIAVLTSQLDFQKTAFEKKNDEKAESDRIYQLTRETVVSLQAEAREAHNASVRLQQDLEKTQTELSHVRVQCEKKEEIISANTTMYLELQKSLSSERFEFNKEVSSLKQQLNQLSQEKIQASADCSIISNQLANVTRELEQIRGAYVQTQGLLVARDQELATTRYAAIELTLANKDKEKREQKIEELQRELVATQAQLNATETEYSQRQKTFEAELIRLESAASQQRDEMSIQLTEAHNIARSNAETVTTLESQLKELQLALVNAKANSEAAAELGRVNGDLLNAQRRVNELLAEKNTYESCNMERIKQLEEQIRAGEVTRRKMHNTIQELRGNVRVFARIRPFLPSDGVNNNVSVISARDDSNVRIMKVASNSSRAEDHHFTFDKAFGPSTNQETLFEEVSEFVQSALDGYNVCLFSFGQTGSGKTHTMQGSGDGAMRGIIPRAMQQVGRYKLELEKKGWVYDIEASFVEIYNETIRDLLRDDASEDTKHEIKKDAAGNTYVSEVVMIPVDLNNTEQMENIMQLAAKHRSVGQTAMNERSSRSHSVFTLHLKASNASQNISLKGMLNLVDLAGSERLDRSGATGDRLKETAAINKSLSALTDVFLAIGNKQPHVPYRNSKLTYLLQPALSGDGKTLMMVNLSPTEESFSESLSALRFAQSVNQCELGKPKRNLKEMMDKPANNLLTTTSSVKAVAHSSNSVTASITRSVAPASTSVGTKHAQSPSRPTASVAALSKPSPTSGKSAPASKIQRLK